MTLDAERKHALNQVWMDSLLQEALNPERNREQERLAVLFAKRDFNSKRSQSGFSVGRLVGRPTGWLPIAIAASITIVLGSWSFFPTSNQRAYAAIARGLQPAPHAREYSIRIVANSFSGAEVTKSVQLFLDRGDRFAVHRRGWLGLGDIWFGSDGKNQWVAPRLGPALIGNERILGGWLSKRDSTAPFLHIQTILKRMEKGYTLQMLPDANFDGVNGRVLCERVRGEWNERSELQNNATFPTDIELWSEKESGIVHRLVLNWGREPNQIGPIHWTIDFQGFPALAKDWFELSGHTAPGQRVVTIGKESELDSLPKSSEEAL